MTYWPPLSLALPCTDSDVQLNTEEPHEPNLVIDVTSALKFLANTELDSPSQIDFIPLYRVMDVHGSDLLCAVYSSRKV